MFALLGALTSGVGAGTVVEVLALQAEVVWLGSRAEDGKECSLTTASNITLAKNVRLVVKETIDWGVIMDDLGEQHYIKKRQFHRPEFAGTVVPLYQCFRAALRNHHGIIANGQPLGRDRLASATGHCHFSSDRLGEREIVHQGYGYVQRRG